MREYLSAIYEDRINQQPPAAAVWVSCDPSHKGEAIRSTAAYRIVHQRLGITSVHRLRHTFASGMEEVGAKVSDIQERLGHSNLSTTSIYLGALRRDENPCGNQLDRLFGIEKQTPTNTTSHTDDHTAAIASQHPNLSQSDQITDFDGVHAQFGASVKHSNQGKRDRAPNGKDGHQLPLWGASE